MVDLRQLRYFVAISEEEHFGRAAARLHVAQPALTRQIQKLESQLQAELFERLPRGVRLTAAGHALFDDARRLLADLSGAIRHAQLVGRGEIGILRVGYIEVAAWDGALPASISRFRHAAPQVSVELISMSSIDQLAAIREGKIDAGYLYNPPAVDEGLVIRPVARHGVLLAVPAGSPLARKQEISLSALASEPILMFERSGSPAFYDELQTALAAAGLHPRIPHGASTEVALLTLVSMGEGLAIVNACNRSRKPQSIELVRLTGLDVTLELCLVHHRANRSPPLRRFVTWLDESNATGAETGAALP